MPRLAAIGGTALLASLALVYFGWFPFHAAGPPMADFSAYYAAGRAWTHHIDPYGTALWNVERSLPGQDPHKRALLPYVGPPLGLPVWALFGHLPYAAALLVWGTLLAFSAVVVLAVPARAAPHPDVRTAGALLLLGLACAPLVTAFSGGQAALPAAAAVDIALVCALQRRWFAMALGAVVAAALKPNDALVLAGAARSVAAAVTLAGAASASALANAGVAGGLRPLLAYAHILADQTAAERTFALQLAPASIAYHFGFDRDAAALAGALVAIGAFAVAALAIRRTHASALDATAIACAAFPFVVPFEHEPDLVIVLLPALMVVFRARGRAWALGAAGAVMLCVNPFALALGPFGVAFAVTGATVAALQISALGPALPARLRLAPLAVVPLVALLGVLAKPTPLPMWPDALPAHIAVAETTAATEWHDELAAAGLTERRPSLALFRLVPLTGCGAIAFAMTRIARRRLPCAEDVVPRAVVQAA